MSEFFPKQEDTSTPTKNEENVSAAKNPVFKYPDKMGTAFSYKNTYLTSTPVRKDAAGSERMRASTMDGNERIRLDDIGQSSETRERLKPFYNGEESSRDRLLRLSSGIRLLYVSHEVDIMGLRAITFLLQHWDSGFDICMPCNFPMTVFFLPLPKNIYLLASTQSGPNVRLIRILNCKLL